MAHLSVATDFYAHAPRANDLYVAMALNGLLSNPEIVKGLSHARRERKKIVELGD